MADKEQKDYTPLLTNLTPNDAFTVQDIEMIFNLSDEEIERIARLRPKAAENQYNGRNVRERIINYIIGILTPSSQNDINSQGLSEADKLLVSSYIRDRNSSALYNMIVTKSSAREKVKSTITDNFKYMDAHGKFREKRIPNTDGSIPQKRDYKGTMRPLKQDTDKSGKPTNSSVYMYLKNTRGLSDEMIKFLEDNKYIYQGVYDTYYSEKNKRWENLTGKYVKRRILVVNGFLPTDTAHVNPVYQSLRETWDVWDADRTSKAFLDKCKERPDFMYEGKWRKENGEFIFTKKIKQEPARNSDGSIIKDANNQTVWKDVYDENGNPVYEKKKPFKKDNSFSDKNYSCRLPNPNMTSLYVFEAPLDCFSFIDMMVQSQNLYTPSKSIDTSKLANFLTTGGLNYDSIQSFLYDNPQINKVFLCFDNDSAGKNATLEIQRRLIQQFNFSPENVIRLNCPPGYQKVDINGYGMRDEQGKFIEVKDYNEMLRAWTSAGRSKKNMARIGEDYAKENKIGEYGSQTYQISQKVKEAYTQMAQSQPGGVQSYENIPPVPKKRGGIVTAALYRDQDRVNMRTSVIDSLRDDGMSAQDKYKMMAGRKNPSIPKDMPNLDGPSEPIEPQNKGGEER